MEVADGRHASEWDAYVRRRDDATLYHRYGWKNVAEKAYGLEAPFLCARDEPGGPIRGILPLFRVPRPFAPYLTNGLFGAYGPVLADRARHGRALLTAAMDRVDERAARYLHLKLLGNAPHRLPLQRRDIWVTAHLDLSPDFSGFWRRLPRKQRWSIRTARRAGLAVARGHDKIAGFYDVLSENLLRKGAPVYGRAFFEALLAAFGREADVVVLEKEGRVVSGAFVMWFRGTMYVPFASSRPSVFGLHANPLLFFEVGNLARELGLDVLDFGTSLRDSASVVFKKNFRPRFLPVSSYVYAPSGARVALAPDDSPAARVAVRLWSRLPPRVADVLGPRVCRWIA